MFPKKKCSFQRSSSKKVYFDPKIALHSFHLSKLQQSLQLNFKEQFLGVDNTFTISKEGSVENRVMIRCTQGYFV